MTYESSTLVVDDREPNARAFQGALQRRGVRSTVARLSLGDFRWTITNDEASSRLGIIVERKTVQDLLNSVADGRLGRFVDHVPNDDELRILLIERSDRKLLKAGFKWKETGVDNVLLECQMRGVHIVQCQEGQVVDRITSLWKWTMQPQHRSVVKPKLASISSGYIDGDKKRAVQFLVGIPGFGEIKALAALRKFGSVNAVLDAIKRRSSADFKEVPGVGRALVLSSAEFLEREIK